MNWVNPGVQKAFLWLMAFPGPGQETYALAEQDSPGVRTIKS